MEMIPDILKVYGPLSLGWVVAAYLLKFVLDRYKDDIEARVALATALDGLSKVIDRCEMMINIMFAEPAKRNTPKCKRCLRKMK